jgi:hypothetical protein
MSRNYTSSPHKRLYGMPVHFLKASETRIYRQKNIKRLMDVVYIGKCRYEFRNKKKRRYKIQE